MRRGLTVGTRLHTIVSCVMFTGLAPLTGCAPSGHANAGPWRSLFNGEDLSGWMVKCRPDDRGKALWRVDHGTILADSIGHEGHDYVWLVTESEYSDFILRLSFQVYRENPGNSGVQIRSRYDDQASWLDGPQVDINPPDPWRTGMIWDETRGSGRWLSPDVPKGQWVDASMANPDLVFYYADEGPGWNRLEIRAVGTEVIAILNGVVLTHYEGSGVLDDQTHKKYEVGLRGHLALQIHRGDQFRIRFTDVAIRELP